MGDVATQSNKTVSSNPYHHSFNLCAYSSGRQNWKGRGDGRLNSSHGDYSYFNATGSQQSEFHCDNCDRSFRNDSQYKNHVSEHEVCGREGCKFTAHPKIIANHVRTQHDTGLFKKIHNLKNPEEIAKWIAERKRRYPTKKNIEAKAVVDEDKESRGERIKTDNSRFNKHMHGRHGNRQPRNSFNSTQREGTFAKKGNNGNRSRKRKHPGGEKPFPLAHNVVEPDENCGIPRFCGTGSLYLEEVENPITTDEPTDKKIMCDISDEEDYSRNLTPSDKPYDLEVVDVPRSLGLLIANYGSDSEEDVKTGNENPVRHNTVTTEEKKEDAPEEVKTIKSNSLIDTIVEETRKRPMETKKMHFHEKRQKFDNRSQNSNMRPQENFMRKRRPTLLEKLLSKEIMHERNLLLQCFRYIVKNNFFEKPKIVETNPTEEK